MLDLHQVLFALCVVLSCNVSLGKSDITRELEKINTNLVERVPHSEELKENTEALRQMFDGLSKVNLFNIEYRKTLEKLNHLTESRCDKIIIDNFELIDRSLHYEPREEEPSRRLAKVVKQLMSQHAETCLKVYQTIFHSKVINLNLEKADYVDILLDSLYDKYNWRAQSSKDLFQYYIKSKSYGPKLIWWPNHMKGVLKALQTDLADDDAASKYLQLVRDEVTGTEAVNEEKLREIFNRYLINPCKHYVSELGPLVFAPANYDCSMYHHWMVDKEEQDFYLSWVKYRTCDQLLADDSYVFKLLVNYI